jgi:D-sedoheptulose 7-phosphate isomerase
VDIKSFSQEYFQKLQADINHLDLDQLAQAADLIWQTYQADKTLYFIGNGGSAATASHMANDFGKGLLGHKGDAPWKPFKAVSLTDNVSLITAWANDTGYDRIFVEQLKPIIQPGDLLVAISASGNSPNIIEAVKLARAKQAKVLGLAGFTGGKLKELSDICLWVKDSHYGRVEDLHLIFDHLITNFLYQKLQLILKKTNPKPLKVKSHPTHPTLSDPRTSRITPRLHTNPASL